MNGRNTRTLGLILLAVFWMGGLSQAQTLSITNGLVLWLEADSLGLSEGQSVSAWADSSTNGNNTSQATASLQPTFHTNIFAGKPGVRFDGADDFLGLTRVTLSGGLTYFAVFRTTSGDAASGYPGNAPLNLIGDHTGNISVGFGVSGGFAQYNHFQDGFGWKKPTGTTVVNDGVAHLVALTHSTAGAVNLYTQGLLELSTNITYRNPYIGFDRISGGYLDGSGTADVFAGDVAEILVYGTALSASDRQDAYEYLVAKYALPEPNSLTLVVLGLLACCARRARDRSN